MDDLLALAPYLAIIVAVHLLVAGCKLALVALQVAPTWRERALRILPALAGAGFACVPGLLGLPVVQRAALGLVLGEFAASLYDAARDRLRGLVGGSPGYAYQDAVALWAAIGAALLVTGVLFATVRGCVL